MEACLLEEGLEAEAELLDGHGADMLGVEPGQLVVVEDGVGLGDAFKREELDEFFRREEFAVFSLLVPENLFSAAAGGPAEQGKEVAEGFRKNAHLLVGNHACSPVTLGEPRLVRTQDQRNVSENGQFGAESAVLQHLLGRIRDVICAANDVGEAHIDVVGHDAEVIGGDAV